MDGAGALRLVRALRNATQHTGTLFGNDVRTAYQLLGHVLQHESWQQGFDLAATQDADFHEVGGWPLPWLGDTRGCPWAGAVGLGIHLSLWKMVVSGIPEATPQFLNVSPGVCSTRLK